MVASVTAGMRLAHRQWVSNPTHEHRSNRCDDVTTPSTQRLAPGKNTRSEVLQRRTSSDSAKPADSKEIAAAGVAGASDPLPFLAPIARSFGRYDVSGVKSQTGGDAGKASKAIGARAYATEGRVAFDGAPDLHTAAHEAAHVVQQRAGVQLKGGVGARGDVYEQHADRVADLVVRGESAEAELGSLAGGGSSNAVQCFDSPHHIELGDSVEGESVTVNGVTFSPGELGALVDYVGRAGNLKRYSEEQLLKMKELLAAGSESVSEWDAVTDGNYSKESQANDQHFAPGGGGANFRDEFIGLYAKALFWARDARNTDDSALLERAQLLMYTAEHYFQDAFSAGHQFPAQTVADAVTGVITGEDHRAMLPRVARETFERKSSVISQYDMANVGKQRWVPIDSVERFSKLAVAGGYWLGIDSTVNALRQFVHERLGELGVEVSSPAHPEPWVLKGDHDIKESPASIVPLQAGLHAIRTQLTEPFDLLPQVVARKLFDHHCPVPTADGAEGVAKTLAAATENLETITSAVIESSCKTIKGIMDFLALKPIVRNRTGLADDPAEFPEIPDYDPEKAEGK